MTSRHLIKGAAIWSEAGFVHEQDVLIESGRIVRLGRGLTDAKARTVDAREWLVLPGLVDLHAHLDTHERDDRETLYSGLHAAAWGGFTTVLLMPDTDPPVERESDVEYIRTGSQRASGARALVCAALTKNRAGRELTELAALKGAGAVAAGDAQPIRDARIVRNALQYTKMLDMPLFTVAQDDELSHGGMAHEGDVSLKLGLAGMPAAAEWIALSRDLLLAESMDAHLHVQGVSTARSVELLREAKSRGVSVTAECSFHNLLLSDEALIGYDPNTKLSPPLRPAADVTALIEGVATGVIDAIVTDHTPLSPEENDVEFVYAEFGAAGFEAILPVLYTELIVGGALSWEVLVECLSVRPRNILRLPPVQLTEGQMFEATLFNPEYSEVVQPDRWQSRAANTPLAGRRVQGRVEGVYYAGRPLGRWAEEAFS